MELSKESQLQAKLSEIDNGHFSNPSLGQIRENFERKFQAKLVELYDPREFSSDIRRIEQQIDSELQNIVEDFGYVGLTNLSHRLQNLFQFYHTLVRFLSQRCNLYFSCSEQLKQLSSTPTHHPSQYCIYCQRTLKLQNLKFLEKPFQKGTIDSEQIQRLRVEDERKRTEIEELMRMELYAEGSESYMHNLRNILEEKEFYLRKGASGTIEKLEEVLSDVMLKQDDYLMSQLKSLAINFQENGLEIVNRITNQILRRIRVLIDRIFRSRVEKLSQAMCFQKLQQLKSKMISTPSQTQDWKVIDTIKMLQYRNQALTRMLLNQKSRVSDLQKQMLYQIKKCQQVRQQKSVVQQRLSILHEQLQSKTMALWTQNQQVQLLVNQDNGQKQIIESLQKEISLLKGEMFGLEEKIGLLELQLQKEVEEVEVQTESMAYSVEVQTEEVGKKGELRRLSMGREYQEEESEGMESQGLLVEGNRVRDREGSKENKKPGKRVSIREASNAKDTHSKTAIHFKTISSDKSLKKLDKSKNNIKSKHHINSSQKNLVPATSQSTHSTQTFHETRPPTQGHVPPTLPAVLDLKKHASSKKILMQKTNRIIEAAEKQEKVESRKKQKRESSIYKEQKVYIPKSRNSRQNHYPNRLSNSSRHNHPPKRPSRQPQNQPPSKQLLSSSSQSQPLQHLPTCPPPLKQPHPLTRTPSSHFRASTLPNELPQIHQFKEEENSRRGSVETTSQISTNKQIKEEQEEIDEKFKEDLLFVKKLRPKLSKERFSSFRIAPKIRDSRKSNFIMAPQGQLSLLFSRKSLQLRKNSLILQQDLTQTLSHLTQPCPSCQPSTLQQSVTLAKLLTQLTLSLRQISPQSYSKILALLNQDDPFMLGISFMRVANLHRAGCEWVRGFEERVRGMWGGGGVGE